VLERVLEHLDGLDVEVVRRLVEDEAVGPVDHQAEEGEARALAAAQRADGAAHLLVVEEEGHQLADRLIGRERAPGAQRVEHRRVRIEARGLPARGIDVDPGPAPACAGAGLEVPARTRASTVLPAPLGPTTPTRSLRGDHEVHVEQHRSSPNATSTPRARAPAAAARCAAQRERHLAPLEHRALDLLHLVDLHLLDARLADHALVDADVRPVAEPPHGLLEARDLLLLAHIALLLTLHLEPARDRVGGVRPRPDADAAGVELRDRRHAFVEQVTVVGDHQDRAREVGHEALELIAAAHVQMGLGLVEQQHVGAPREARREGDELALPAAQVARRARERLLVQSRGRAGACAPRPPRDRRPAPPSARAAVPGAPALSP
jgi:hypothetical protein